MAGSGVTTVFDALRVGWIASEKETRHEKNARSVAGHILGLRDAGG